MSKPVFEVKDAYCETIETDSDGDSTVYFKRGMGAPSGEDFADSDNTMIQLGYLTEDGAAKFEEGKWYTLAFFGKPLDAAGDEPEQTVEPSVELKQLAAAIDLAFVHARHAQAGPQLREIFGDFAILARKFFETAGVDYDEIDVARKGRLFREALDHLKENL